MTKPKLLEDISELIRLIEVKIPKKDVWVPYGNCMGYEKIKPHKYTDGNYHLKSSTGICDYCLNQYKQDKLFNKNNVGDNNE